jgi:RNA polymerase sigma factor (sigma-70 family)
MSTKYEKVIEASEKSLTKEEEIKLFTDAKSADPKIREKARGKICLQYQSLIHSLLHKYAGEFYDEKNKNDPNSKPNPHKENIEDIEQECFVIILENIDKFDPNKARFSTFIYNRLKHGIIEFKNCYINNTSSFQMRQYHQFNNIKDGLETVGVHNPDYVDIAIIANKKAEVVERVFDYVKTSKNTLEMDKCDEEGKAPQVADTSISLEKALETQEGSKVLIEAILDLPEQEKLAITYKYGIGIDEQLTIEEIRKKLNLSSTRDVRNLINNGINLLGADVNMKNQFEKSRKPKTQHNKRKKVATVQVDSAMTMLKAIEDFNQGKYQEISLKERFNSED